MENSALQQNDESDVMLPDQWEILQRRIINDGIKIMTEFRTVPVQYLKAFHCLNYQIRNEERLGAIMREVKRNGIGFEKTHKNQNYITRDVNSKSGQCLYLPRPDNNKLFLFYLAHSRSIREYQVKNKDDICEMNFILKDWRDCKAIVLPQDTQVANKIMREHNKERLNMIDKQKKEAEQIKLKQKKKNKADPPNFQLGYELFYIVDNISAAKQLKLDGLEGRFAFDYKEKYSDFKWNAELRDIPRMGLAQIEMINQVKLMER